MVLKEILFLVDFIDLFFASKKRQFLPKIPKTDHIFSLSSHSFFFSNPKQRPFVSLVLLFWMCLK